MLKLKIFIMLFMTLYLFTQSLNAKEFANTSYYVAYDKDDATQYVLVLPSVKKAYTHEAGNIAASDLKLVDDQFVSFPIYNDGNLCFSALKSGATGESGASVMAEKCYEVKFFYTQKEIVTEGVAFILFYAPEDKVYEGLAGDSESFEVVREGGVVHNENSITGDNYTNFSFNVKTGAVEGVVDEEENTSDLSSLIVGQTKYFANSLGGTGYRNYADDGSYVGNVTLADGRTFDTSGTYSIINNVLTVNRTSPSASTLVLTSTGLKDNTLMFNIVINGGKEFQTLSFESVTERDNYISSLNSLSLLNGKTFYDVGQQENDPADIWSGKIIFNTDLTELTYTGSDSSKVEISSIKVTGNKMVFGEDSDGSYSVIGESKGDYIEVTDYYSDGTIESHNRLYFEKNKADTYFETFNILFSLTTDYLNGKSLYFVQHDDFGYDDMKWNMARMDFTVNTFNWTEYDTEDNGTHSFTYSVNSDGNIVYYYGTEFGDTQMISSSEMTEDYVKVCQDGDCNTYLFFDEGKARDFRDNRQGSSISYLVALLGEKTFYNSKGGEGDYITSLVFNADASSMTATVLYGPKAGKKTTNTIGIEGNKVTFNGSDGFLIFTEITNDYLLFDETRFYFDQTKAEAYWSASSGDNYIIITEIMLRGKTFYDTFTEDLQNGGNTFYASMTFAANSGTRHEMSFTPEGTLVDDVTSSFNIELIDGKIRVDGGDEYKWFTLITEDVAAWYIINDDDEGKDGTIDKPGEQNTWYLTEPNGYPKGILEFTKELVSLNPWYVIEYEVDGIGGDVAYCNGVFAYDGNSNLTASWNDPEESGSVTAPYSIADGKVVVSHDDKTESETLLAYENGVITTKKETEYDDGSTPPPSGNKKWFNTQLEAEAFLSNYTNLEASSCF